MDTLSRKIELYETMTGKTSKYLNAWSKVLMIILLVANALGLISSLSTLSAMAKNPLTIVSLLISVGVVVVLVLGIVNARKANKDAYISYITIGIVYIVSNIITTIYNATLSVEDLANASGLTLTPDMLEATKAITIMSSIVGLIIVLVLVLLHIVYMVKRKDLFLKTVEQLEEEAGVSADEGQYAPYINPQG